MKHAPAALCAVALALLSPPPARAGEGPADGAAGRMSLSLSAVAPVPAIALPADAPAAGDGVPDVDQPVTMPVAAQVAAPAAQRARTGATQPAAVAAPRAATPARARFDLSVNDAPAGEVFTQLGAGTGYNVLVPPDLSGSITVGLKNTTVPEALDILREMFGYDYRISGSTVLVYPNTVQTRVYRINYLPGRRQGSSDLRVTSTSIANVPSSDSSSSGSGSSSSSESSKTRVAEAASVKTTSDADFWREVQLSLTSLVGAETGRSVVLNVAAGVIVVRATPREHRHVGEYLRAVQVSVERQVMLEAKIIEVQLKNEAQSGVNWGLFRGVGNSGRVGLGIAGPNTLLGGPGVVSNGDVSVDAPAILTEALGKGFYGLTVQAANFSALLNFLQTQGDVQVLSSPRIATINNQKAVLKVGTDELFVTKVTTSTSLNNTNNNGTTTSTVVPTVELTAFFSGIVLDVTPQIDDAGAVILHVHPSISQVVEKKKDLSLGNQGVYSLPLPLSNINETDSIVRVKDGHIVAIGGLMSQTSTMDRSGLPGLSDAPVVGALFRQKSTVSAKRELVVLIKPTVITDVSGWPSAESPVPAGN